jgi:hypothetical protein
VALIFVPMSTMKILTFTLAPRSFLLGSTARGVPPHPCTCKYSSIYLSFLQVCSCCSIYSFFFAQTRVINIIPGALLAVS